MHLAPGPGPRGSGGPLTSQYEGLAVGAQRQHTAGKRAFACHAHLTTVYMTGCDQVSWGSSCRLMQALIQHSNRKATCSTQQKGLQGGLVAVRSHGCALLVWLLKNTVSRYGTSPTT